MSKGQRLTELINEAGIKQNVLAKEIGVDPSAITQFKKDDNGPAQETSEAICRFFKVNLEWFLTGAGEKFSNTKTPAPYPGHVTTSEVGEYLHEYFALSEKERIELIELRVKIADLERENAKLWDKLK